MKFWLQRWDNLTVSRKLTLVACLTALLIALEMICMYMALDTLSAVRGFVAGESQWSKAQKNAVANVQLYIITRDEKYFTAFIRELEVPNGDSRARREIFKDKVNEDIVYKGLFAGKNHEEDIPSMMKFLRRFRNSTHLKRTLNAWEEGDVQLHLLVREAIRIREELMRAPNKTPAEIKALQEKIFAINDRLSELEAEFSNSLGEAARFLEKILIIVLITLVVLIGATSIFVIGLFLNRMRTFLEEISVAAEKVGKGNLEIEVPVHSQDEFGQLATSINLLTSNLQKQTHQRINAEEASQAKSLFLANMSHEIRTPLTAILGFSELLMDDQSSEEEKKRFMEIIKRSGKNLSTVINDILDLSKIEAKQLAVSQNVFSLSQLVSDIQIWLQMKCIEKSLSLKIRSEGNFSDYIYSDPVRLRQILSNIIGNAIKFTHSGSIEVIYGVTGDSLEFIIKDTGVGIKADLTEKLFKPFSQGDSSIRKQFEGTGLGLVISRNLAKILGGDVQLIRSHPGKGSTFSVKIAYIPSTKEKAQAENDQPSTHQPHASSTLLQNKKILVVEDSEDNQYLFGLLLGRTNAEIEYASNGAIALEKFKPGSHDLILMDMQMPVMDGYTATRELRKLGCTIPIIACTGYAMNGDKEKCLDAGCDGFISKPIDSVELIFMLFKLVRKTV